MTINRPIFVSVATCAFSGATLLAFLLSAHSQIATIGEMDGLIPSEDPDEYLCSCGQKIKVCEFWQSVKTTMRDKGFEFDVAHFDMKYTRGGSPLIHRLRIGSSRNSALDSIRDKVFQTWPGEVRQLKPLLARNVVFIETVMEVTGKEVFVDTSKNRWRLKILRKFSAVDVRAIHLVRDVKGVVASRLRRHADLSAHEAARQWVALNKKLEISFHSLSEESQFLLRYEDLCQDVQGTLEQLHRFCGVNPGEMVTDLWPVQHHIVGNTMRLRAQADIRLDESWRSQLTKKQLKEIDRAAGALNRRYGYC